MKSILLNIAYSGGSSVENANVMSFYTGILDHDGDGVDDYTDDCDDTPSEDDVDSVGCTLVPDADNDGVSNMHDLCPSTLPEVKVDATGCKLETPTVNDNSKSSADDSSNVMTLVFIILGISVLGGAIIYTRRQQQPQEAKQQPELENQENTTAGASGIAAPDLPVESSEDSPSTTETEDNPNS